MTRVDGERERTVETAHHTRVVRLVPGAIASAASVTCKRGITPMLEFERVTQLVHEIDRPVPGAVLRLGSAVKSAVRLQIDRLGRERRILLRRGDPALGEKHVLSDCEAIRQICYCVVGWRCDVIHDERKAVHRIECSR